MHLYVFNPHHNKLLLWILWNTPTYSKLNSLSVFSHASVGRKSRTPVRSACSLYVVAVLGIAIRRRKSCAAPAGIQSAIAASTVAWRNADAVGPADIVIDAGFVGCSRYRVYRVWTAAVGTVAESHGDPGGYHGECRGKGHEKGWELHCEDVLVRWVRWIWSSRKAEARLLGVPGSGVCRMRTWCVII